MDYIENLEDGGFALRRATLKFDRDAKLPKLMVSLGNDAIPLEEIIDKTKLNRWYDIRVNSPGDKYTLTRGVLYKGEKGQLYVGLPDFIHASIGQSLCFNFSLPFLKYFLDGQKPKIPEGQEFDILFRDTGLINPDLESNTGNCQSSQKTGKYASLLL